MKKFKIILTVILCFAVAVTTATAFHDNYRQNKSGRYSAVTIIKDNEREWILERFDKEYKSIEEYIITVQDYACENFRYDYGKKAIIQFFDFGDIVDGDKINGICFDFAVLFKHITLVLSEEGILPNNIKVYVADIKFENFFKVGHSYNVLTLENGDNYYLDLTSTATRGEKGLKPKLYYEKFETSIKDYAKSYNETLFNIH